MTYTPRFRPYAHQLRALEELRDRPAFALLMAMRTGKTKTLLDDWGRAVTEGKASDLLVIAPAGVYATWETAAAEHLAPDLLGRTQIFRWVSGAGKTARRALDLFLSQTGPRIFVMNIEALSAVEAAREAVLKFLADDRWVMVAVDESTTIKNPSAQRTKFLLDYVRPRARFRRILSGLPAPKAPLDLYSQFAFLDPKILGFSSYYAFRARYAIMRKMPFGGRQVPIVVGYRDIDELRSRIAPHSFRVTLEECYDLPEKVYMRREVSLTSEQEKLYKEMKMFASAKLAEETFVSASQAITQILRLHQILCGHLTDEFGGVHEVPENRTKELISLLEEYDGKAIIWCSYDADVRRVSEALRSHFDCPVARFWGGNRGSREVEEKQFLNDPDCRFIVATAAAGGRGRTWMNADLTVYYSNTNDLEHRSQSEERAQGVGKTRPVTYVDLVASGTVDEKIIRALREKINMASVINGDNYRDWLI